MEKKIERPHLPAGNRYAIGMNAEQGDIYQLEKTETDKEDPERRNKIADGSDAGRDCRMRRRLPFSGFLIFIDRIFADATDKCSVTEPETSSREFLILSQRSYMGASSYQNFKGFSG